MWNDRHALGVGLGAWQNVFEMLFFICLVEKEQTLPQEWCFIHTTKSRWQIIPTEIFSRKPFENVYSLKYFIFLQVCNTDFSETKNDIFLYIYIFIFKKIIYLFRKPLVFKKYVWNQCGIKQILNINFNFHIFLKIKLKSILISPTKRTQLYFFWLHACMNWTNVIIF